MKKNNLIKHSNLKNLNIKNLNNKLTKLEKALKLNLKNKTLKNNYLKLLNFNYFLKKINKIAINKNINKVLLFNKNNYKLNNYLFLLFINNWYLNNNKNNIKIISNNKKFLNYFSFKLNNKINNKLTRLYYKNLNYLNKKLKKSLKNKNLIKYNINSLNLLLFNIYKNSKVLNNYNIKSNNNLKFNYLLNFFNNNNYQSIKNIFFNNKILFNKSLINDYKFIYSYFNNNLKFNFINKNNQYLENSKIIYQINNLNFSNKYFINYISNKNNNLNLNLNNNNYIKEFNKTNNNKSLKLVLNYKILSKNNLMLPIFKNNLLHKYEMDKKLIEDNPINLNKLNNNNLNLINFNNKIKNKINNNIFEFIFRNNNRNYIFKAYNLYLNLLNIKNILFVWNKKLDINKMKHYIYYITYMNKLDEKSIFFAPKFINNKDKIYFKLFRPNYFNLSQYFLGNDINNKSEWLLYKNYLNNYINISENYLKNQLESKLNYQFNKYTKLRKDLTQKQIKKAYKLAAYDQNYIENTLIDKILNYFNNNNLSIYKNKLIYLKKKLNKYKKINKNKLNKYKFIINNYNNKINYYKNKIVQYKNNNINSNNKTNLFNLLEIIKKEISFDYNKNNNLNWKLFKNSLKNKILTKIEELHYKRVKSIISLYINNNININHNSLLPLIYFINNSSARKILYNNKIEYTPFFFNINRKTAYQFNYYSLFKIDNNKFNNNNNLINKYYEFNDNLNNKYLFLNNIIKDIKLNKLNKFNNKNLKVNQNLNISNNDINKILNFKKIIKLKKKSLLNLINNNNLSNNELNKLLFNYSLIDKYYNLKLLLFVNKLNKNNKVKSIHNLAYILLKRWYKLYNLNNNISLNILNNNKLFNLENNLINLNKFNKFNNNFYNVNKYYSFNKWINFLESNDWNMNNKFNKFNNKKEWKYLLNLYQNLIENKNIQVRKHLNKNKNKNNIKLFKNLLNKINKDNNKNITDTFFINNNQKFNNNFFIFDNFNRFNNKDSYNPLNIFDNYKNNKNLLNITNNLNNNTNNSQIFKYHYLFDLNNNKVINKNNINNLILNYNKFYNNLVYNYKFNKKYSYHNIFKYNKYNLTYNYNEHWNYNWNNLFLNKYLQLKNNIFNINNSYNDYNNKLIHYIYNGNNFNAYNLNGFNLMNKYRINNPYNISYTPKTLSLNHLKNLLLLNIKEPNNNNYPKLINLENLNKEDKLNIIFIINQILKIKNTIIDNNLNFEYKKLNNNKISNYKYNYKKKKNKLLNNLNKCTSIYNNALILINNIKKAKLLLLKLNNLNNFKPIPHREEFYNLTINLNCKNPDKFKRSLIQIFQEIYKTKNLNTYQLNTIDNISKGLLKIFNLNYNLYSWWKNTSKYKQLAFIFLVKEKVELLNKKNINNLKINHNNEKEIFNYFFFKYNENNQFSSHSATPISLLPEDLWKSNFMEKVYNKNQINIMNNWFLNDFIKNKVNNKSNFNLQLNTLKEFLNTIETFLNSIEDTLNILNIKNKEYINIINKDNINMINYYYLINNFYNFSYYNMNWFFININNSNLKNDNLLKINNSILFLKHLLNKNTINKPTINIKNNNINEFLKLNNYNNSLNFLYKNNLETKEFIQFNIFKDFDFIIAPRDIQNNIFKYFLNYYINKWLFNYIMISSINYNKFNIYNNKINLINYNNNNFFKSNFSYLIYKNIFNINFNNYFNIFNSNFNNYFFNKINKENQLLMNKTYKGLINNYNNNNIISNKIIYNLPSYNKTNNNSLFDILNNNKLYTFNPYSNPINMLFKNNRNNINNNNNKQILIHKYLKNMSLYNSDILGTVLYYNKFIAYNFNHNRNKLIKEIYDILFYAFKSMSCLISKPVFKFHSDKVVIHLFYYLLVPAGLKNNKFNNINLLKRILKFKILGKRKLKKIKFLLNNNKIKSNKNLIYLKTRMNYYLNVNNKFNKDKSQFVKIYKLLKKNNNTNNLQNKQLKIYIPSTLKILIEKKKNNSLFKFNKRKNKLKKHFIKLNSIPLTNKYPNSFKSLCLILSKFFNKKVELNLIRVHYPYSNANILVNFFALLFNKVKIFKFVQKLFKNALFKNIFKYKFTHKNNSDFNNILSNNKEFNLPAFLTGIKFKFGGRNPRERIKPRKSFKIYNKGTYCSGKSNYMDVARFTGKNKRGSFSLSINASQSFFNQY